LSVGDREVDSIYNIDLVSATVEGFVKSTDPDQFDSPFSNYLEVLIGNKV
jgi:hypothetical protein